MREKTESDRTVIVDIVLWAIVLTLLFVFLTTIPTIFDDEGFYLRLAAERIYGIPGPLSLAHVTSVSPQFPETPFYGAILGIAFQLFGVSLHAGRLLTTSVSLLIVMLVWVFVRRNFGQQAARWSTVGLIFMPFFWQFGRTAIPHGLTGLLIFTSFCLLVRWRQSRWRWAMVFASMSATLAVFVSYWALFYLALFPLLVRPTRRPVTWLAFLPFVSLAAYWLQRYAVLGEIFVRDFQSLTAWESTGGMLGPQSFFSHLVNPVIQFIFFCTMNPAVAIGLLGFVFLRDRWLKWSLLSISIGGLLFLFRDRQYVANWYLPVVVVPFIAIGIGNFFENVFRAWVPRIQERILRHLSRIIVTIAILGLFMPTTIWWFNAIRTETTKHYGAKHNALMNEVTNFVRQRTTRNDFVIASPEVFWLLPTRAVDITWVYARELGRIDGLLGRQFYARYETDDRFFSYPTNVQSAKYVIVSKVFAIPALKFLQSPFHSLYQNLYSDIDGWPLVFENGLYQVYQNKM